MRRQDQWLLLADRLEKSRLIVVSVCALLNLKRSEAWVAKELRLPIGEVHQIAEAARPLLRQSDRATPSGERVCVYCGSEADLTRDHVKPKSRGGGRERDNLAWACRSCNSSKGARTPSEWIGQ